MFDEMLGRLSTSANIVGTEHAFSLKNLLAVCILIVVPSLKRTAPSQRMQIITIEMLDEMLGHLNTSPKMCKICWLKCWVVCWIV